MAHKNSRNGKKKRISASKEPKVDVVLLERGVVVPEGTGTTMNSPAAERRPVERAGSAELGPQVVKIERDQFPDLPPRRHRRNRQRASGQLRPQSHG